ncbi:MAG TPA: acetolactate synthase [Planctomycetota bacterium]|nr:acetolactate synthase [Planctomycetota bacterium]
MKVRKEITVALENAPGRLGHLCECIAAKKINILAISVVESANMGLVRVVVDKPEALLKMLKGCPLTASVAEVLELAAPNKTGVLAKIASKLGKKRVNIEYVYGTATGRGKAAIILKPSSIGKARPVLRGM